MEIIYRMNGDYLLTEIEMDLGPEYHDYNIVL